MHNKSLDIQEVTSQTAFVSDHQMHAQSVCEWLTPEQVSKVLPNTSAKSVRDWCGAGKLPGAIRLPSGRWQIPWSSVIGILGFDPRDASAPVEGA